MAEDKMTYEKAEKRLWLKAGEIKWHKDELKAMKAEMVMFVLTDIESTEPEYVKAAEDIVDGILDIAARYGMRKMFAAEPREDT